MYDLCNSCKYLCNDLCNSCKYLCNDLCNSCYDLDQLQIITLAKHSLILISSP